MTNAIQQLLKLKQFNSRGVPRSLPKALPALLALALTPSLASAANGTWTNAVSGGLWSAAANWSAGTVADGSGNTADFSTINITADPTVARLDTPRTLGGLTFGDAEIASLAGWVLDNNATAANILTLAGGTPTITVNALGSGKTATVGPVIAGSTAWTKAGPGTLVLTNANTFSGGFTVSAGALVANVAGALGANGTAVVNGTLNLNAGATTYPGLTNGMSGSGMVNIVLGTGSATTSLNANNSGFNGIINLGTNGLTGAVAATGAGKVQMLGLLGGSAVVNALANSTLIVNGAITNPAAIKLYGGDTGESLGQLRIEGNAVWSGPVTLAGNITGTGDGTMGANSGTGTVSGNISEAGGARPLIKTGGGNLVLSGANTWTGPTIVNGGTLTLMGNQAGVTGGFYVGTNTATCYLNLGSGTQSTSTTATVAPGNIVKTASAGTSYSVINVNASNGIPTYVTNNGSLSIGRDSGFSANAYSTWYQNGDMTVQANGGYPGNFAVTANGNFIYAGTTLITNSAPGSSGSASMSIAGNFITGQGFYFNNSGSTGRPLLTLATGGRLVLTADIPQLITVGGTGPAGRLFVGTNGTVDTAGFSTAISLPVENVSSQTGSLVKSGLGTLQLDAANTYTGPTTISGGTLALGAGASLASQAIILTNNGTFDASPVGAYILGASQTLSGSGTVMGTFYDTAGSQIYPGGNGSVGTLNFSSDLNLAGSDTLNFDFSNGGSNDVINVNGTLNPYGVTTINLARWPAASGFPVGDYVLLQATTLGGSAASFVLANVPGRQSPTLIYDTTSSPQKLILSVAASGSVADLLWQGGLNGNAWDVQVTPNWLKGASTDSFYSGDHVTFSNVPAANASVVLAADVAPGTTTFDGTNHYVLSSFTANKITGPTALIKNGTGSLTLTIANDYTGGTAINGGTLQLGDGVSYSGEVTGNITNQASLIVASPYDLTMNNAISGSGHLTKAGTGALTLAGNNSFAGGTTVSNGILKVATATGLGAPTPLAADINGGATLNFDNSASFTQSGQIVGSGAMLKTSTGAVTLAGTNTFNGGLTINLGAIYAANDHALGLGPVVIDNLGAGSGSYSQLFLKNGVNISNAISVVSGASYYQGVIEIDAGAYGYGGTSGSGSGSDTNGATLSGPVTLTPGTMQRGSLFCGPFNGTNWLAINGPVTNSAGTIGSRNGRVRFSGGGDYAALSVAEGRTSIGAHNGVCPAAALGLGSSTPTVFDLNGFNQTLTGLSASLASALTNALITNSAAVPSTLTLNLSASSTYNGAVAGKLAVVLNGSGTQTLGGTNRYTGNTTVNGGTLQIAVATLATNSSVAVASGAILQLDFAETNTVGALVLDGASQAPGVYNSVNASPYLAGTGSLLVVPGIANYPTNINYSVNGNTLTLTWPETHLGWYVQTNAVSVTQSNAWFPVPGSNTGTNLAITINPSATNVFFRLRSP